MSGEPWRESKGPVTSIANEIRRNLDNYTSDQSECTKRALAVHIPRAWGMHWTLTAGDQHPARR